MVRWREVLNKLFRDEQCAKFWVLLEIFNFWSKFLSFKGVSPRKKWQKSQKKLRSKFFMLWWSEELNILYQDKRCPKFWVLLETFNFWSKFLSFKTPTKKVAKSQKKLRSQIFMVWWREVLIKLYQDEWCPKFWLLLELFNFWSKYLSFRCVSPRKKWRNPKKFEISNFHGMM